MIVPNDGGAPGTGNAGDVKAVEIPAWMSSLPDAHKTNPNFAQFKEAPAVWDKFDSLLKAEGSTVAIPGEKATEAERVAFFTKLGRPEKADAYEVAKPADWPADVPYNAEDEAWFKTTALKHNLTTAQAKGLYADYLSTFKGKFTQGMEAQKAAAQQAENTARENREKAVGELKKEWAGDAFSVNVELAKRAVTHFGGADLTKFLDESGMGDNIPLVKVFAAIGKALSEDTLKGGPGGGTPPAEPGMHYESMKDFANQK
jgi:hypothetical protein